METTRIGFPRGWRAGWAWLLAASCTLAAGLATGAELRVGAGSSVDLGTAALDLGCADLVVAGTADLGAAGVTRAGTVEIASGGTLVGGTSALSLTGDWIGDGTFVPDTSSVAIVDGCGATTTTVLGETTFADLSITSGTGREVFFESGAVTTVQGHVALQGTASDALVIRSTVPGDAGFLAAGPDQSIAYVDVDDNWATLSPLIYDGTSSVGSNAMGWILATPRVPAVGVLGVLALGGLLAALGRRRLSGATRSP